MRVLFCKIHCPLICFCKPSPHLFTPGPLKLENTPRLPSSSPLSLPDASGESSCETVKVHEEKVDGKQQVGILLKSILRKAQPSERHAKEEVEGKKVQWMDFLGKELVEIKEFEPNENEDTNFEVEVNRSCLCIIL